MYKGADPFGQATIRRSWDDGSETMENYKRRLEAGFEFFTKLGMPKLFQLHFSLLIPICLLLQGVKYWTFHDRDISPEGPTLAMTNRNLDEMTDLALNLQRQTGIQLLWNTCNLFAHPRYVLQCFNNWTEVLICILANSYANGAATNPNAHVVAYAAAQVKKGLEIGRKLGAQNFVFWGGREGYK